MLFITPVTDRTGADAAYARQHPGEMTKGAINYVDLNRMEGNCKYLADEVSRYGYSISIDVKTDWKRTDFPTLREINRIRNNVLRIIEAYSRMPGSPDIRFWGSLDWRDANALELNIANLDRLLQQMASGFRRCGTFYCGQEVVLP